MSKTKHVRGILISADLTTALPVVFYEEGTETVVSVGANDIVTVKAARMTTDTSASLRLFFSSDAAEAAGSSIAGAPSTALIVSNDNGSRYTGLPGKTVYARDSVAQAVEVYINADIYKS